MRHCRPRTIDVNLLFPSHLCRRLGKRAWLVFSRNYRRLKDEAVQDVTHALRIFRHLDHATAHPPASPWFGGTGGVGGATRSEIRDYRRGFCQPAAVPRLGCHGVRCVPIRATACARAPPPRRHRSPCPRARPAVPPGLSRRGGSAWCWNPSTLVSICAAWTVFGQILGPNRMHLAQLKTQQ